MKIKAVSDLLITAEVLRTGLESLKKTGNEVSIVDWAVKDLEELQEINLKIEQHTSESYTVSEQILDDIKDAEIIITQFFPITKKVMDACPDLKVIGVLRSGIENVNKIYAEEKGIQIINTPGRNANAVADFTVGMLLSECRNIAKSHLNMKEGRWIRDYANHGFVPDLSGKIAGIIGYGQIGRKVAKRLKAFDMTIRIYDPYVPAEEIEDAVVKDLNTLVKESDFITLHTRLTEMNHNLIDRPLIEKMKPTAYLINTARAGLVDEEALYEALKEGKIMGAALDVFQEEPLGHSHLFLGLENVTLTPHLSGSTADAFKDSPKILAKRLSTFMKSHA